MGSTGRSQLEQREGKLTVRNEYACHEGNYALSSVLQGARYEERMNAQEQDQTTQR